MVAAAVPRHARGRRLVFYRCQADTFGDMPMMHVDDDSYTDEPAMPLPVASAMLDMLKRTAPPEPGLWLWDRDTWRRFTDQEVLELASGRLGWLNPMRPREGRERVDVLHPTGRCVCAGAGGCDWCVELDLRLAREGA
jgi:hypothetical protein